MTEKTIFGDIEVNLKWVTAQDVYTGESRNVTSCFVLPIFSDGKILLTENPRGIDLIGGHVENNESKYNTMLREAKEEGSIEIKSATLIGAIEVHNPNWNENSKYPETAYQLFYTSRDFKINEFVESHECIGRVEIEPQHLEEKHHNFLNVHKEMLKCI